MRPDEGDLRNVLPVEIDQCALRAFYLNLKEHR